MLPIEDRLEIFDLYARYAHTVDAGDSAAWCECFTADGYLAVPVNKIMVQGPERLSEFAQRYYRRSGGLERHLVTNLVLAEAPGGAAGRAYLTMLIGGSGTHPPRFTTTGIYHDRLVRTAAGWRFAARDLHVDVRPDE